MRPINFPFLKRRLQPIYLWCNLPAERGSLLWVCKRMTYAVLAVRFPVNVVFSGFYDFWYVVVKRLLLRASHMNTSKHHNSDPSHGKRRPKILYASPVGCQGKEFLEKLIRSFEGHDVDFWIFVYDDAEFNESVFKNCRFIREKGLKWFYMKKYLTPKSVKSYDYILPWDDDIDILDFDMNNFLDIMRRNNLVVAQPSLDRESFYTHRSTLTQLGSVGRYTDFVEIMVQVFTKQAWAKYWHMLEDDWNHWGWGYDVLANSICQYTLTGIVDAECVRHTKAFKPQDVAKTDLAKLLIKHKKHKKSSFISYAKLR
jgi:hypothetical protein